MRFIILFTLLFLLPIFGFTSVYAGNSTTVSDTIISFHTVKSGENLYRIAIQYNTSVALLCKVNQWKNCDYNVKIGERIRIARISTRTISPLPATTTSTSTTTVTQNRVQISKEDSIALYTKEKQRKEDSIFLYIVNKDKVIKIEEENKPELKEYEVKVVNKDTAVSNLQSDSIINRSTPTSITLDTIVTKHKEIEHADTKKSDINNQVSATVSQTTNIVYNNDSVLRSKNPEREKNLKEVEIKEKKGKKKYKIGDDVSPNDIEKSSFYLARAMKAIDAKAYNDAEQYITKAIKLNPNYTEAYMLHADLYNTFHYYDKSLKEYDKAVETNKTMPMVYYNRGTLYLKMGDFNKALKDFSKAISLDSTYILALGGRASVYMFNKKYDEAISDYNRIISLNPFFSPVYKARAEARLEIEDLKGAIADCTRYLEIEPNDAYVYYQRGMARMRNGDTYNACLDLLRSSELGYDEAAKSLKKFCN